MSIFERIISDLERTKEYPAMYVYPVAPEFLRAYLHGLEQGVILAVESSIFNDFVSAGRHARRIRGWPEQAMLLIDQMRAKEMSEDEIFQELLEIDIQKWKILEDWVKEDKIATKV